MSYSPTSSSTTPLPTSWAPDESSSDLWEERSNFAGIVLSSAAYGVHFTLFLIVFQHLYCTEGRKKRPWALLAYITLNFVLGTFGIAAEAKFNEMTFIDDRNFPGGPDGFIGAEYGIFINIFGTAAYVVLNWLADGLVIYRFWLLFDFNYYVVVLPTLILLGSISMGIILLFQLTQPNANLWTITTVNFGIPYWSLSASLNILVTTLIVSRLLYFRRAMQRTLGDEHARTYTGIVAMLVESAALFSVTALIFIITYARNSNVQNLVLPVLGQVQAISPLLIMWRVARGQAWSRATLNTTSHMSWRTPQSKSGSTSHLNSHFQAHPRSPNQSHIQNIPLSHLRGTSIPISLRTEVDRKATFQTESSGQDSGVEWLRTPVSIRSRNNIGDEEIREDWNSGISDDKGGLEWPTIAVLEDKTPNTPRDDGDIAHAI